MSDTKTKVEESSSDEGDTYIERNEKEFPNAKFDISLSNDALNNVISNKKSIVVMNTYNCYCYENSPRPTDFFIIKTKKENITERMIIDKLIKSKFNPKCNHSFYEGTIYKTPVEDVFEMFMGS